MQTQANTKGSTTKLPKPSQTVIADCKGAVWDGSGVHFSVYAPDAGLVELCLFTKQQETAKLPMQSTKTGAWELYVPDCKPGQHYGYRAHGNYQPKKGLRFNPYKLMLDPYAKAVSGKVNWCPEVYDYQADDKPIWQQSKVDNAAYVPKSVVIDPDFAWEDVKPPRIPWEQTIIYELHVKGFTKLHPAVPEELRGTYLGLAHPAVIEYLQQLGITAVELLPVATALDNQRLHDLGLTNYWGYDPIAYFAPDARFAVNDPVHEFKTMVKALHQAGLEVILDVVFNHTGEGGNRGISLAFRGLANKQYYRLAKDNPEQAIDTTGCGNSLQVEHPQVQRLVLDCLRYWAQEMQVDGFRFDLATTVARQQGEFAPDNDFLTACKQDPILSQVKFIAEPWDLGFNGYQLGQFPQPWAEWNDQYRDKIRAYWRGDENKLPRMTEAFCGSQPIFAPRKAPLASINFITAHDGFTLRDLVSYNNKHNAANGEDNRDGNNNNLSANYGVEGDTDVPAILAMRAQQQRNMLATLILSQGVPMLLAGDERNHSQSGNNNTYCQDNEMTWLSWQDSAAEQTLQQFVQALIQLRRSYPVFRRSDFLQGKLFSHLGYRDINWLRPDGCIMGALDWQQPFARCIQIVLPDVDANPNPAVHWLLTFNAADTAVECTLPPVPTGQNQWQVKFDTANWPDIPKMTKNRYTMAARSLRLAYVS